MKYHQHQENKFYHEMAKKLADMWGYQPPAEPRGGWVDFEPLFVSCAEIPILLDYRITLSEYESWLTDCDNGGKVNLENFVRMLRDNFGRHKRICGLYPNEKN